jgi:co-chaperonin GroES (HSP10)
VIRRETLQQKTSIIIPASVNKDNVSHDYGVVQAVGPECDESIQPGMKVMFGKYAGGWFEDPETGEKDVFVCQDEDIIAVIEEADG